MKYSPTRTDMGVFLAIDRLLSPAAAAPELAAALESDQWQLQQAALWSIATSHRDPALLDAVTATLDAQDKLRIYEGRDHWTYEDDDPVAQEEHRCRYRVKQAAVMALAAVAATLAATDPRRARATARIEPYATSMADDYAVRAEACRALGLLASPSSRATLEKASADGEWCTATEAAKALARLASSNAGANRA